MNADALRQSFLLFFKAKEHRIIESDSLVPRDDPTVLFTPAGMNQFKKQFLGMVTDYRRAATAQRCIRTDDLEKVGKTPRHHTFFEMLGNFSFGDYFKEEAITWAWEFLTCELHIPAEKLWVSVYNEDDEAYAIWRDKVGIPQHKIIKLGDKDNFWPAEAKQKGPNGPCGPCSEIFFDQGPEAGCGRPDCTPACGCDRYPEVWNLVFTQFNRKEGGVLEPLPQKNIDTGMGLERLAAVMQGKANNFETDLFQPIVKEIRSLAPENSDTELVYAVADHIRAAVFCIYDGVSPSNEGRGYVVRKVIRKSIEHLRQLGIDRPVLNRLVPLVALTMQGPYPDLKDRQEDIALVVLNEENNFIKILEHSDDLLESNEGPVLDSIQQDLNAGLTLASPDTCNASASAMVRLYETYGIPLSLSKTHFLGLMHKKGLKSDPAAIEAKIRDKLGELSDSSRSKSKLKGDVFDVQGLALKLEATRFVGYEENSIEARVLAILKDRKEVDEALAGERLEVVLDQTPFYAESGGQVGDTGRLASGRNVFEVLDTQKIDDVFLHIGEVRSGSLKKGDRVIAQIDAERRLNIMKNHTATHILQAALRKVLGSHVQQQGSLVAEDKLRFDFTHFKGLSEEEIARVEEVANGYISRDLAVSCKEMPLKDAKKAGALAFFEEKYGDSVRVVSMGDISKELCGGTHLDDASKIGLIKIISEGSVASGIRRIEAATGIFAERFIDTEKQKAAEEAKKKDRIKELKEQEKRRSREVANSLKDVVPRIINNAEKIKDLTVASSFETGLDMNALRLLADKLKKELRQGVIALGSQDDEQKKAYLVIALTPDLLSKGLDAEELIRRVAPIIGGSGGGRKDFAQAGGSNPRMFDKAIQKLKEVISES